MAPTNSTQSIHFRSIFYGLWLGALVGGALVTLIRPLFYAGARWFDVGEAMRTTVVYVLPTVITASFTLLPALVRYGKLHFAGFTCAGLVAGVILSILYLVTHHVLGWFSDASAASIAYVVCSAVLVAWVIAAASRLTEFICLRRGAAPP